MRGPDEGAWVGGPSRIPAAACICWLSPGLAPSPLAHPEELARPREDPDTEPKCPLRQLPEAGAEARQRPHLPRTEGQWAGQPHTVNSRPPGLPGLPPNQTPQSLALGPSHGQGSAHLSPTPSSLLLLLPSLTHQEMDPPDSLAERAFVRAPLQMVKGSPTALPPELQSRSSGQRARPRLSWGGSPCLAL